MVHIKVLQLKRNPETRDFMFSSSDYIKRVNLKISLDNYDSVYETDINEVVGNIYDFLESLFMTFQDVKLAGYRGHSLSTSDIIQVNGINFYCDSIGFTRLNF